MDGNLMVLPGTAKRVENHGLNQLYPSNDRYQVPRVLRFFGIGRVSYDHFSDLIDYQTDPILLMQPMPKQER